MTVSQDRSQAAFSFDYIDYSEGCVIQFVHTGDVGAFKVSGKIRGAESIVQIPFYVPVKYYTLNIWGGVSLPIRGIRTLKRRRFVHGLFFLFSGFAVGAVLLYNAIIADAWFPKMFFAAYALYVPLVGSFVPAMQLLRRHIPKGLSAFEEEF